MKASINLGDIAEWAAVYDGPLFHSFLCDPPYHLSSIVARYGAEDAAAPTGRVYARSSAGFMGKQWDGGDVAFRPETWAAIRKLLHPGAFSFAFASTRGFHRMAVAMEDAGFIIHPAIMAWGFGSGFPKGTRIDTQIDKAAGADRKRKAIPAAQVRNQKSVGGGHGVEGGDRPYMKLAQEQGYYMADAGEAVTDEAKRWVDYRYGGQALKPAFEPIVCIQNPYPKRTGKGAIKPFESINATGAGALNIGGGAVKSDTPGVPPRYPPGLALVHHPHCTTDKCIEGCPVDQMSKYGDQNNGRAKVKKVTRRSTSRTAAQDFDLGTGGGGEYAGDSGSADRYFERVNWQLEADEVAYWQTQQDKIDSSAALFYAAKVSSAERNKGLKGGKSRRSDARPDSPDSTGKFPDHDDRESSNPHPTLKPIALTRWLATLLLPPDFYAPRRILVPFAGAGSETIGCAAAGWDEIVGVELTSEYADVARQRLDYWLPRFEAERAAPKPQALPIEIESPAAPAPKQLDFLKLIDSFLLQRPD